MSSETLAYMRQKHITTFGKEHWEQIVGEQDLRTRHRDRKGMTRELMDNLVSCVADARLDEWAGFEGENLDYEILSLGHDVSLEWN